MNKRISLAIFSVLLCAVLLTACNTKKMEIQPAYVDIKTLGGSHTTTRLQDGTLRLDVTKDAKDIEFDFTKFFKENPEYMGEKFYLTRDDVLKGDNTLIRGSAWQEYDKQNGNRRFKKIGKEFNDDPGTPRTKGEIMALEEHEGKVRMYILKDGKHLVYFDPTPESNIIPGESPVTFRLHGHHGRVAELKVLVMK